MYGRWWRWLCAKGVYLIFAVHCPVSVLCIILYYASYRYNAQCLDLNLNSFYSTLHLQNSMIHACINVGCRGTVEPYCAGAMPITLYNIYQCHCAGPSVPCRHLHLRRSHCTSVLEANTSWSITYFIILAKQISRDFNSYGTVKQIAGTKNKNRW
jgi:hypothetical protein